ncbi:MAG TPA: HNH endonuclease signature motif containing protein, partial [Ilumatobacteraceae bacterium]|nr:HNH endonuclease signature motif containing protein [Ilumatobacteraceae bacterium]
VIDWGQHVDIPRQVLVDLINGTPAPLPESRPQRGSSRPAAWARQPAMVVPVVLDGTTVVQAPGQMDRYRESRAATKDQRRVLRVLYPTCAIPGCRTPFAATDIHHVTEWWPTGLTNLDNLLPVCAYHHHKIHDDGWKLKLHADRTLQVTFPDGSQMSTGPPARAP